jgi:hypothetical protein
MGEGHSAFLPPLARASASVTGQFRLIVICLGFASSALGFHLDKWL